MFSTLGVSLSTPGCAQYTGGYQDECGDDIMTTAGLFSTLGDTMSTLGDTMMSVGDIMSTLVMFSTLRFPYKFKCFPITFPHIYHDIPPVYS